MVDLIFCGHAVTAGTPLEEPPAHVEAPAPGHDAAVAQVAQLVALNGMDVDAEGSIKVAEPLGIQVAVGDEQRAARCYEGWQHGKVVSHLNGKGRGDIVDTPRCQCQVILRIKYVNSSFQRLLVFYTNYHKLSTNFNIIFYYINGYVFFLIGFMFTSTNIHSFEALSKKYLSVLKLSSPKLNNIPIGFIVRRK